MLGELFDFSLEFSCRDCRGLETRRCAAVGTVGYEIELVVDHGSVTGEHDHREVLACAARHVAIYCGERLKDSALIRLVIGQKQRLDLGIEAAL